MKPKPSLVPTLSGDLPSRSQQLHRRLRWFTCIFIAGLVLSGATAIPLETELGWLAHIFGVDSTTWIPWDNSFRGWIWEVWMSLRETKAQYPFLFYGTDWLVFGHFVIAIAFIGALRDPVRNRWLFDFGLIACVLVIPYALCFGGLRGIPFSWRLIDCSFGAVGFIPLWFCRKWAVELEQHDKSLINFIKYVAFKVVTDVAGLWYESHSGSGA